MKLPEDIRAYLFKKYDSKWIDWLTYADQKWPLYISLKIPTEQVALSQTNLVRTWVEAWQNAKEITNQLSWTQRKWKILGLQEVPEKLFFSTPEQVAQFIGKQDHWQKAKQRWRLLIERWPLVKINFVSDFDKLIKCSDEDFNRLLYLVQWILDHPDSNLYPRQLPIPGLDSKWLESHKTLVGILIAAITHKKIDYKNFGSSKESVGRNQEFHICLPTYPPGCLSKIKGLSAAWICG